MHEHSARYVTSPADHCSTGKKVGQAVQALRSDQEMREKPMKMPFPASLRPGRRQPDNDGRSGPLLELLLPNRPRDCGLLESILIDGQVPVIDLEHVDGKAGDVQTSTMWPPAIARR